MNKAKNKPHIDRVFRLYDMSPEQYAERTRLQEGHCLICNTRPPRRIHGRSGLVVDHDHSINKWRGLVCDRCNSVLGHAKDDARTLLAAAAYLWRHKNGIPTTNRYTLYAQADILLELLDSIDFDVAVLRGRPPRAA